MEDGRLCKHMDVESVPILDGHCKISNFSLICRAYFVLHDQ